MTTNKSICWIAICCLLLGGLSIGCDGSKVKSASKAQSTSVGSKITRSRKLDLLAIGVPEFGDEIVRQWSAKQDGELSIVHMPMVEFEALRREEGKLSFGSDYDLIVFPASVNADLYSAELIREIPKEVVDEQVFNRTGILRHFRRAFVRHDSEVRSICLGGLPPVLLYRKDVLEKLGVERPTTWDELASALGKIEKSKGDFEGLESGFLIPTKEGDATKIFLARAASEIRSLGKLTTCFDRKTMKPLLDQPPFERALKDLKSLARESVAAGELSSEDVFLRFAEGKCAFAFARPIVADPLSDEQIERSVTWGVMGLPGSREVFDLKEGQWTRRREGEKFAVNSMEFEVINIGVSTRTAKAKDSFEFAVWLAEKQISSKVLPELTGPLRASHLGRIDRWLNLEDVDRDFQDGLSDWNTAMHEEKVVFMFPQLLRRSEYLGVLDESVAEFLAGEGDDVGSVLSEVLDKWESLTDEIGREAQVKELSRTSGL